jgi:DNA-binding Lrp family transcriptional regulator
MLLCEPHDYERDALADVVVQRAVDTSVMSAKPPRSKAGKAEQPDAPRMRRTSESAATEPRGQLDELDRGLVEHLRRDGRASNRSLSAALGVNEVTVASRLRRLAATSVMRVVALTDIEAFGHQFLAFAKIRVAGTPMKVGKDLAGIREVISVVVTTGRFDLIVCVLGRDREHLADLVGKQIPSVKGVEEVSWELALQTLRFDSRWAALSQDPHPVAPWTTTDAVDEFDLEIIRLLQVDARTSNRRIAAELGVSEGAIRARIKRMEDQGVIRIQAVSDVAAFGVAAFAYLGIQVTKGRIDEVAQRLLAIDSIAIAMRSLGEFDLFVVAHAESRERLIDLVLNKIAAIPGVHRTETFEGAGSIKHSYTWARLV